MAHPELDQLADFCLHFAQHSLAKRGGFHPFGASIGSDGKLTADTIQIDVQHSLAQSLIDAYMNLYRSKASAGEIRAAAICWDSRVTLGDHPKTDAISIGLEHSNGESVAVYCPYTKNPLRRYDFGDLAATARPAQFFPSV